MTVQKAFTKIHLQNDDDVFLMSEYELDYKLAVKILNIKQNEIYVGHAEDVELRSQAAKIRLTFKEYIDKTIKSLFGSSQNDTKFVYCLDKKNDVYTFKWKSIDFEETVINLGSMDMKKGNFVFLLTDILQSVSLEMLMLNDKVLKLEIELNQSKSQTSEILKQLSVATDMKKSLEDEMYAKFVCVLNEKKRKIEELMQKPFSNNNNNHKKKSRRTLEPVFSDSSDDAVGLLDSRKPGPSIKKEQESLLFLDDNNAIMPINQKRIRSKKIHISRKTDINDASTSKKFSQPLKEVIEDNVESDDSLLNYL
ncbi:uncharacterized protein TNIN_485591 [Trichonephila inaurata madagascariensis]|uniref:DNA repair protein XRCC4 n=1 Tax=Trichonephila inaurata madagascariensis TaxID=2747483 RepID=A0A8X6J860_9ARAC|nr:uncharacterized protein TNIN_485591 [Trichonephila inaurata madagascariensis]